MLWRAASQVGLGVDAVVPAQDAGLIELNGRVRFRHPLVRSAIYQATSAAQRQEVHRVLAEVDRSRDRPRPLRLASRARHAAPGRVSGPRAGSLCPARTGPRWHRGGGGVPRAFGRAESDSSTRGQRALAAAEARFESGALDKAVDLLAIADASHLTDAQRARLGLLRARITYAMTRGTSAPPLLLDAARLLEPHEPDASRDSYLEALGAAIFAGRLLEAPVTLLDVAAAARHAPPGRQPPRPTDLLMEGVATQLTEGYVAGVAPLRRAVAAFGSDTGIDDEVFMRWSWLPFLSAAELWDDNWQDLPTRAVRLCRESGALFQLPLALGYLAMTHLYAGEFTVAATLIAEGEAITEATGSAPVGFPAGLLDAWRGDEGTGAWEWREANARARGEGRGIGGVGLVRAILLTGLGRYDEALASARTACEFEDFGTIGLSLSSWSRRRSGPGDGTRPLQRYGAWRSGRALPAPTGRWGSRLGHGPC